MFPFSIGIGQDFRWINEYQYMQVNSKFTNPNNILKKNEHQIQSILLYDDIYKIKEKSRIVTQVRGSFDVSKLNETTNLSADADIAINETYFAYGDDKFSLSIGRKKINWGVSYVASPTDLISRPPNPEDSNDHLFAIKGSDVLQLSFPREKSQFELIFLPATNGNKTYEKTNAFASRYYRYLKPFDLSFVARFDENLEYQTGVNLAVSIGQSIELHGEYVFDSYNPASIPDIQSMTKFTRNDKKTMRFLLGGQWSPSKKINWAIEYLFFLNGYTQSEWSLYKFIVEGFHNQYFIEGLSSIAETSLIQLATNPNPLRKKYIFNRVYYRNLPRTVDFELVTFTNIEDLNTFSRIATNIRFKESSKFSIFSHLAFLIGNPRGGFKETSSPLIVRLGMQMLW